MRVRPLLAVLTVGLGLAASSWAVESRVNIAIDFQDPKVVVTVQGGEPAAEPEAFVRRHACPQLLAMQALGGLPVPYTLQVLVRTGAGTWRPDPARRVEGLLRQCQ